MEGGLSELAAGDRRREVGPLGEGGQQLVQVPRADRQLHVLQQLVRVAGRVQREPPLHVLGPDEGVPVLPARGGAFVKSSRMIRDENTSTYNI